MSWAIWITGLPASRKSVLARIVERDVRSHGEAVVVLELDQIRRVLTPSPSYSDAEREVVYRSLVYMGMVLTEAGVPVLIDATGHPRRWRQLARVSIRWFAEVQLVCPLEICRERERARAPGSAPRAIYARAGRPGATVPGVDVAYEPSVAPDLVVNTACEEVSGAAARIASLARRLAICAPPPRHGCGPSWAIWITRPPGTETTVVSSAAAALGSRGVVVQVLDSARLLDILRESLTDDVARDIARRALAYTTKLLTDAGVPVIIDATTVDRAWLPLARTLVGRFAEAELGCPSESCAVTQIVRLAESLEGPAEPR